MKKVFLVILAMIFVFSVLSASITISAATVDKTELAALVSKAENLSMENFNTTIYAWNMFSSELEYAKNILANPNVTQSEVNYSVQDLSDAIARLGREVVQTEAVDKSDLKALIDEAIMWKRADFTVDNSLWNELQGEIANAIMTFNNTSSTQQNIDNAINNLVTVMDIVYQYKVEDKVEDDIVDSKETQSPNAETNVTAQPIVPTESVVDTSKTIVSGTKPMTETRPKSTTPFLQGGFIELGCDASIAFSALAIVGIIGSALVIKKKHD